MEEKIVLKVKKSSYLNILNIILKVYTIFLFFFALIIDSNETIIQTMIMFATAAIFDFINSGEFIVSEKGIEYDKIGFAKWNEIEFFNIRNNIIEMKLENASKKISIDINVSEDKQNIDIVNKYANSKIKNIDKNFL